MGSDSRPELAAVRPWWILLVALPLVGLAVLLVRPELDLAWEHQPSHFWLVLASAVISAVLAYLTHEAAARHRDARIVLVSLAFLASAGFLALHALATPGVLLSHPNTGFAIATPVGLVIAAVYAFLSVSRLGGPRAMAVLRWRRAMLAGTLGAMVAWGVVSLAGLPPLDGPLPEAEGPGVLAGLAVVSVALYGWAAWRSLGLYRDRGGALPLAIAVALVLLAEAMIAIATSRNWHLSWWEWHLLLLAAYAVIAIGTRHEYARSGSLTGAFGGLYLQSTLARIDRWHGRAIARVAAAQDGGDGAADVVERLRSEGASTDELRLITHAADELRRLDDAFRPYLPTIIADRAAAEPQVARLGGTEQEVSVLFADLSAFTTFSERHAPTAVIGMLNDYWAAIVPVIDAAGGEIEQFAGDAVMAVFNAAGDQPDHARRAADAALAIIGAGRSVLERHPDWPAFRVGVSTGHAVVGNVGTRGRRSFAVIGDTTNTSSRLTSVAGPGEVLVTRATWEALDPAGRRGEPLGPVRVKGRREPIEVWRLRIPERLPQPAGPP
jgi:class 3 adenylate cyclase